MSKKHFIALADMIRAHNPNNDYCDGFGEAQLRLLADFLEQQNPRFNRDRWLDYIAGKCGPSGGKVKPPAPFPANRNPLNPAFIAWRDEAIRKAQQQLRNWEHQ